MLFVVSGRPLFECLLAALVVDWANAAAASLVYVRRGDADLRVVLRWGVVSLPLIVAGVAIAHALLPRFDAVLGGAAGPIALGMGGVLLRRAWRTAEDGVSPDPEDAPAGISALHATALLRTGLTLNAVIMGLLGQSGGLNTALLLIWLRRFPTRVAVATSMLLATCVLPVGIAAWLFVVGRAPGLWGQIAPFVAASALASGVAAWQSARIPERRLEFVVAGCVLLAGAAASIERWLVGV